MSSPKAKARRNVNRLKKVLCKAMDEIDSYPVDQKESFDDMILKVKSKIQERCYDFLKDKRMTKDGFI